MGENKFSNLSCFHVDAGFGLTCNNSIFKRPFHIEKMLTPSFSVGLEWYFRENLLPFLTIFIISLAYNMDKKVIDSLLELIIKNIVTVFKEGKAVEKFIIVTFSKVRQ